MVNDYRGQIKKVNIRGCIICVYVCIYKQAYLCVHMYMYISSIETDPKMEGSQMIPATFFFFFFFLPLFKAQAQEDYSFRRKARYFWSVMSFSFY